MTSKEELRHLQFGPAAPERPVGLGLLRFTALCQPNADRVLKRSKEVMCILLQHVSGEWPFLDEWSNILPEWFVLKCAPETTEEEDERWLAWWRKLSIDQQAQAMMEKRWTLSGWIYWFQPGKREWFWWDAAVDHDTRFRVSLENHEWPCPVGAFEWLLRASGALDVNSEH